MAVSLLVSEWRVLSLGLWLWLNTQSSTSAEVNIHSQLENTRCHATLHGSRMNPRNCGRQSLYIKRVEWPLHPLGSLLWFIYLSNSIDWWIIWLLGIGWGPSLGTQKLEESLALATQAHLTCPQISRLKLGLNFCLHPTRVVCTKSQSRVWLIVTFFQKSPHLLGGHWD